MGGRGRPFVRCTVTPGCVRHTGHRGDCKVRVDGKVKPMSYLLKGKPLTGREEEILVTIVNEGDQSRAAWRLGLPRQSITYSLAVVRHKLGAHTTTHAVVLMFRRLGYRYLESPERRRLFDVAMQFTRERAS